LSTRKETAHIGNAIRPVWIGLQRLLDQELKAAGFGDLRSAHGVVFQTARAEGARVTEMAERANITPQAMGQLVDDLEQFGYVTRQPDPRDKRAKLVLLTDRGWAAIGVAREAMRAAEQAWARELGRQRITAFRDTLDALGEWLERESANSRRDAQPRHRRNTKPGTRS
jgi:DNA-binding MarR family transcriptional regulator